MFPRKMVSSKKTGRILYCLYKTSSKISSGRRSRRVYAYVQHVFLEKVACDPEITEQNQVGDEKHFDWLDICGSFAARLTIDRPEFRSVTVKPLMIHTHTHPPSKLILLAAKNTKFTPK